MMRLLIIMILLCACSQGYCQTYIPMPADSATWRYRIYDIDYITQVFDIMVYQNNEDTVAYGNTYHKLFDRVVRQVGPFGFNPPIISTDADFPDLYYGAVREDGKKVYSLNLTGEQLIYDFNVVVGDSIPAFQGKKAVVAIDSILLNGAYHRRYLTTDTAYYVVEGVGSNQGLLPDDDDNEGGSMFFYCFTHNATTFSPDTMISCTYIYPYNYSSAISNVASTVDAVQIFPVPADEVLNIKVTTGEMNVMVTDQLGRKMWNGTINGSLSIITSNWPDGMYYLLFTNNRAGKIVKKFLIKH